MIKHLLAASLIAGAAFGAMADEHDTMYLIKGDHVVGRYNIDEVDYASFTLPEGVTNDNFKATIDQIGKNTVTYTISTVNPNIAYAHNILDYPTLDYMAQNYTGEFFDELSEEQQVYVMQTTLMSNGFMGIGTQSYTQRDFELYGNIRLNVTPGTRYYLCTWEIDPVTTEPLETFTYEEFFTEKAGVSSASLSVDYVGFVTTTEGEPCALFKFDGDSNIKYVTTVWGSKSAMDSYIEFYGLDYLMGVFGQNFTIEDLQAPSVVAPDYTESMWPAYDSGEYVLFVRGYDYDGDIVDLRVDAVVENTQEAEGPKIEIYSKSKSEGKVSINFEISPSNVEEAYVRMVGENFLDDRLNMGYSIEDVAMGGDAIDITSDINTLGEYTFTSNEVEEEWKAILIYAKSKEGLSTTLRVCFFPDAVSEWSIYDPVYKAPLRKIMRPAKFIDKRNPTISKK